MPRFLPFILIFAIASFHSLPAQESSAQTIHHDRIDPAITHQTMDNFSASDAWTMQKIGSWSEANKNRIAELLFSTEKGIGLSCWRFNLGGGANVPSIKSPWHRVETFEVAEGRYDWTRQANERWFLRAAKRYGVPQFIAFVNSPPARMTRSGSTNSAGDTTSTTNLKPGFEQQYARYLADILQYFRVNPDPNERIAFTCVSPVNEPQWDWADEKQEGNRAGNDDIKRIVTALGRELSLRGLGTRILTPESGSIPDMYQLNRGLSDRRKTPYGNYVDAFAGDPAMASLLSKTLCYHSYWSDDLRSQLVQHREQLRKKLDRFPDWKVWVSEYCVMQPKRDLTMETAINVARIIHTDLTVANASAWQWWLAVSSGDYKDGLIFTDWKQPGDEETIIESKLLWAFGNYSRFVRPGMQRVELTGERHDKMGLFGSAYRDPKTGALVVVYVNAGTEAQTVQLAIGAGGNLRAGTRFTPYVTSEQDNLQPKPVVDASQGFQVPARSLVTLVSAP